MPNIIHILYGNTKAITKHLQNILTTTLLFISWFRSITHLIIIITFKDLTKWIVGN